MNGWSLRGISRNRLDLSHGRDRDFFPRIDIADAALTAGNRKAFRRLEERCRSITSARLSSDDSLNEAGKNRARLIDRFEKRIDGRSRARGTRGGAPWRNILPGGNWKASRRIAAWHARAIAVVRSISLGFIDLCHIYIAIVSSDIAAAVGKLPTHSTRANLSKRRFHDDYESELR